MKAIYRDGEFIKPRRVRVAVEKRTTFGKVVAAAIWVDREWESLKTLSAAGANVPKPITRSDRGLLMTYIGDEDDAAPQLRSYRPDPDEAEELLRQVIRNVELFLYRNVIHGDLSPYNILVWDGQVTIIDLPQAVDPRKNRHARALLERDLHRVCDHFERFGVRRSAGELDRRSVDGVGVRRSGARGAPGSRLTPELGSETSGSRFGRRVALSAGARRDI